MEHVTAAAAHHTYHGTRSEAMGAEIAARSFILCIAIIDRATMACGD
jgi:hypothetical protein